MVASEILPCAKVVIALENAAIAALALRALSIEILASEPKVNIPVTLIERNNKRDAGESSVPT